jgi:hypothetical protein
MQQQWKYKAHIETRCQCLPAQAVAHLVDVPAGDEVQRDVQRLAPNVQVGRRQRTQHVQQLLLRAAATHRQLSQHKQLALTDRTNCLCIRMTQTTAPC